MIRKFKLKTLLSFPKTQANIFPAVLIIPGSGEVDHNGNAKGLKLDVYKYMSDYLNNLGYATFRYDKRGVGESEGEYFKTGLFDLLDDIDFLVEELKSNPKISKIYLMGHSEGCILSTIYCKDHNVDGIIQIAGAGTALRSAMEFQNIVMLEELQCMKSLKGKLLRLLLSEKKLVKTQLKLFNKMLQTEKDYIRIQLMKFNTKWVREHFTYSDEDVLNILSEMKIPILAVTGDKDAQANHKDLINVDKLQNSNITTSVISNMDHLLRFYDGPRSLLSLKKQYKSHVGKPLHVDLLKQIKVFLEMQN